MLEKFSLKIIRLTTNEDIIGFVYEHDNIVELKYPKVFFYSDNDDGSESIDLCLYNLLPQDFFGMTQVSIDTAKIIFISYPNVKFGTEYLKSLMGMLDEESELYEQITDTLDELAEEDLDEINNITYH